LAQKYNSEIRWLPLTFWAAAFDDRITIAFQKQQDKSHWQQRAIHI
jgi:hypothetical protein